MKYEVDISKARSLAASRHREIAAAERKGATKSGLSAMRADRSAEVRSMVFTEAGRVAGLAQRDMAAVEKKYQRDLLGIEAPVRAHKLSVARDLAASLPSRMLTERAEQMMSDPLAVDREALGAFGAEARRRGDNGIADSIGMHLSRPAHEYDPEWQEARAAFDALSSWHVHNKDARNPDMPDGSPLNLDDVLKMETGDESQPQQGSGARSQASWLAGQGAPA